MSLSKFPMFLKGKVVKGFGRGAKDLGCPTANIVICGNPGEVQSLPEDFAPGVYYGWAQVDNDAVRKMVVNIGWCPFYQNKEMSIEVHIMHVFDGTFYDSILKICIVGYLRPERNFLSVEELINAIIDDITTANNKLLEGEARMLEFHSYFMQ